MKRQDRPINSAGGDEKGRHVPYACVCGDRSCYGKRGDWFCTTCWQEMAHAINPNGEELARFVRLDLA